MSSRYEVLLSYNYGVQVSRLCPLFADYLILHSALTWLIVLLVGILLYYEVRGLCLRAMQRPNMQCVPTMPASAYRQLIQLAQPHTTHQRTHAAVIIVAGTVRQVTQVEIFILTSLFDLHEYFFFFAVVVGMFGCFRTVGTGLSINGATADCIS